jgi:hypothetical protein
MSKQSSTDIHKINALEELENLEWDFTSTGNDEVAVKCPTAAHDDNTASCSINLQKNVWYCSGCHSKGDIISFITHALNKFRGEEGEMITRKAVWVMMDKKYGLSDIKTVSREAVEEWHNQIWDAGVMLSELRRRGITDAMIRKARLGFDGKRITIPVFDRQGRCRNVRKYLPGAKRKMLNTSGFSDLLLYQPDQLDYEVVWILGGEMKALAASHYLNKMGVGAISVCGSEGAWSHKFNEELKGKQIFICYDIDNAGLAGARGVGEQIFYDVHSVHLVQLPLSPDEYPKGDFNDWINKLGRGPTEEELRALMDEADDYVPPRLDEDRDEGPIHEVTIAQAMSSEMVGKRITCEGVVQARDETPYLVPKDIGVHCDRSQPGCARCPIRAMEADPKSGYTKLTVKNTTPGFVGLIGVPKQHLRKGLMDTLRIPTCKSAQFSIYNYWDVIDARVTPQLELRGDNADHVVAPAFISGDRTDLNTPYAFTGKVMPHPKNQQAVFLFSEVESAPDSLTAFDPTDEELAELEIFRGDDIEAKLDEIHTDLETNVTRIWQRRDLLTMMELTYHSVLHFKLDGRLRNGWVNSVVVGDSSQGKSETALRLMDHYQLGERVDCKNASAAGLGGGLQQMGNRWFVSWGIFPIHDRRLVVCEEVKGMPQEELARLTDMRSSGRIQIGKIEKREAHARTRAIFISNPRSNREVASYSFGVTTLRELFGGPEDVRRCDVGLVISERDVDYNKITELIRNPEPVANKFTSTLCRRLVLWAWTRTVEQVEFEQEAELACLEVGDRLCERFRAPSIPLVDSGTATIKVAKLAAALAARLFSCDSTRQRLIVKAEHVRWIGKWLEQAYSSRTMAYADYASAQVFADCVIDKKVVEKKLLSTKYPKDLVQNMLHQDEIELSDIIDWCDYDRESAQSLMSFLVRKHALFRRKRAYYKTNEFIGLLKGLAANGLPDSGEADTKSEEY